jgi:hypothetical protein
VETEKVVISQRFCKNFPATNEYTRRTRKIVGRGVFIVVNVIPVTQYIVTTSSQNFLFVRDLFVVAAMDNEFEGLWQEIFVA